MRLALQNGSTCEIITSAEHAKEILGGATVIPVRIVSVFARDGRGLNPSELVTCPTVLRTARSRKQGTQVMTTIAYINVHGIDNKPADTSPDTLTLDVGEHKSVALITVNLPAPEGEVSLTQRAHSLLLKYLTDDARSSAIENGSITLCPGCSDADLVAELTKASQETDCISPNPRKG